MYFLKVAASGGVSHASKDSQVATHNTAGDRLARSIQGGLLVAARSAAQHMHNAIITAMPHIGGQAASNFGTLLRVAEVRQVLGLHALRDKPLGKVVGYISAAADAERHLTEAIVAEAEQ